VEKNVRNDEILYNSSTDLDLIKRYSIYGKKLPEIMDGSFAFALYDSVNDHTFCARDPIGIKELYYVKTKEGYCFSSNIDELLVLPSVIKKPNLHSMSTMMKCFAVDYHDTMYEGIYRLPPGHRMTIKNGKKHIERYWFPENIKLDYRISVDEAAKKLKKLFVSAVDRTVSMLKETGFEVSGGLDSSSVVSLLAQKVDTLLIDSYSMSFVDLKCDESEYIDDLLEYYPLNHRKISVGELDYRDAYSLEYLYTLSPNWPISLTFGMFIPMLVQMKEEGKKVIVTGQGGDHLFTGSPYTLYDLFFRGDFTKFYEELRRYRHPWNAFKAYVIKPILGIRHIDKLKKVLGKEPKGECFWNECDIINLTDRIGIKNPAFKNDIDAITSTFHTSVMDGNLFHCAERHFGIEYRHPFFDKELVEFSLSLPPEMKYSNGTIKRILRKAMEGILPDKINQRKDKAEFSEIITQQIEAIDIDALFDDPFIIKLELISKAQVDQCIEMYRSGKLKYVSFLWTIINVEYWYRYNRFEEQEIEGI
jgi:asparagine synthase (glutamine-hydrolysing)